MINVLYIGNALLTKGRTQTSIDTLSTKLSEFCEVYVVSSKSNKVLRLLDMVVAVYRHRKTTDFVVIDTYSTLNFYYAYIVSQCCRLLRKKYIPILHGGNLEERLKKNPLLSRDLFKNAYRLVAPSMFLKNIFKSYGYVNIEYIPNSIDIKNYDFKSRSIADIRLLWVRSFSSIYNPEQAITVLELLKKKGYRASLTMVGPEIDGTLRKIKHVTKQNKLPVKFTGKLSKKDWIKISETHNIFINTTNIDNTPVSVIEAMALGLPVVSTNVGGIPYLIENLKDGLLVPPNNTNAMCDAIIKFTNEKDLRKTAVINARSKVEYFDWEVVKSKWQLLLQ